MEIEEVIMNTHTHNFFLSIYILCDFLLHFQESWKLISKFTYSTVQQAKVTLNYNKFLMNECFVLLFSQMIH